jgi:hypothetical protein
MFKKLTAIAILVISIPVVAYAGAWSLNTWARSGGGTISVNGTAQSVTNGSQFTNYTGGETVSVTITPNSGYTVKYYIDQIGSTSSETADGTLTTAGTITLTSANATLESGSVASLWAVFHATSVSVTAAGDAHSSVNLTNIPFVYPGTVSQRNIVFTFTATPGYVITGITNAPAGTITVSGLNTATAKVTIPTGYVFSSALSFVATSAASATVTTPNPVAAQAIANGATATLTGTYVGPAPAFQNWSCVAKPSGATQPFAYASAQSASVVIPAAVLTTNGTYVFQYRVAAGNAGRVFTSIQVSATAPVSPTTLSIGRTCQGCHTPNGIANPAIYADYSSSMHSRNIHSACTACHFGTGVGGHPGTLNAGSVNSSTFIVQAGTQDVAETYGATTPSGSAAQGAIFCTACHSGAHPIPHSTTGLPATCAGCHTRALGSTAGTGDAHSVQNFANVTMTEAECESCHITNAPTATPAYDAQVANYPTSIHKQGAAFSSSCAGCHGGASAASATHPATGTYSAINATTFIASVAVQGGEGTAVPANTVFCASCHKGAYGPAHVTVALNSGVTCSACHTDPLGQGNGTGDAHSIQPLPGCVTCHAVGQKQVNATLVNDNNGVRAITGAAGEFELSGKVNGMGYRSHHIYNGAGVDPQDAQCIACHLEGKASNRAVSVDSTYHMADGFVHLRSGNTAISANFAWDPANPNHTGMDNFCMSCHNASGAVSAYANISTALYGMTAIPGAQPLSPLNPFGDKLTNAYDQKVRPGVVNVYDQMNPANPSHHAVRGAKYSGRTRNAADPNGRVVANAAVFTQYSGAGNADIHPNKAGTMTAYQIFGTYSTSGPASGFGPNNYPGSRQTIYDAGFFVATYTTLDGATLGDDSTLHCGDCHSVGQWKAGSAKAITWNNSSTASGGSTIISTTAVIGAHGSQNEYMLRTSNGSDSLQKQSSTGAQNTNPAGVVGRTYTNGTYVCFLCHRQEYYGDNGNVNNLTLGTGALRGDGGHGGSIGPCNGNAYSGYGQKGTARYGVLVNGKASPAIGNLFAMSCAHCHNSGQQNFGGIHGATGTYMSYSTNGLDVAGSTKAPNDANKSAFLINVTHKTSYRFMGGESIRYNGGATADKWEAQTMSKPHREGCYNLSQTTDATHLWNTTNPATTAAGGTNAIQNNGNGDSAWGVTDYTSTLTGRYGQNNTTSGWGSCNHHQGSTTSGPTSPTRAIQRPLVY